jgi:RHS repeat-associated protein
VELVDAGGVVRGVIPAGFGWDSSSEVSEEQRRVAVDTVVVRSERGWVLELRPDAAWLADPKTVYPVTIDPTIVRPMGLVGDAYVVNAVPNGSYNSWGGTYSQWSSLAGDYVGVGGHSQAAVGSPWNIYRTYYVFPQPDVSNCTYQSAVLNLWPVVQRRFVSATEVYWNANPMPYNIFQITQLPPGWTVNSLLPNLTWGTQATNWVWKSSPWANEGQWTQFPVTDTVGQWISNPASNLGIWVDAENSQYHFHTMISAHEGLHPPHIAVTCRPSAVPSSPADGAVMHLPASQPVNFTWTDEAPGDSYYLRYCPVPDSNAVGCTNSSSSTPALSFSESAAVFAQNVWQWWRVYRLDENGWAAGPWRRFMLTNTQPSSPTFGMTDPDGYVTTLTPSLTVNPASDPDGDVVKYWFKVCDQPNEQGNCATSVSYSTSTSWTAPLASWAKKYYWTVRSWDGLPTESVNALSNAPVVATTPTTDAAWSLGTFPSGAPSGVVDVSSGNVHFQDIDVDPATVGTEIGVLRSYNSLDARIGAFGKGWTFPLDMVVQKELNAQGGETGVSVIMPDGRLEFHGKNIDGSYATFAYGYPNELTYSAAAQEYSLTDAALTVYRFSNIDGPASPNTYELTSISTIDGHQTTITSPNASTRVARDTASGRQLTFTYTSTDGIRQHITSVTSDPVAAHGGPLTWTYSYSFDRLDQVCSPDIDPTATTKTLCTIYLYDSVTQKISSVETPQSKTGSAINPNPSPTNRKVRFQVDYTNGKATAQRDGVGNQWTYGYPTTLTYPTPSGITATAALHATVTNPLLNTSDYYFDSRRKVVYQRDPGGGERWFEWDANGHQSKATTILCRVTAGGADPPGCGTVSQYAVTSYENDYRGRVTKRTDADGAVWRWTYNSSNMVLTETDPFGKVTTNSYDTLAPAVIGSGWAFSTLAVADWTGDGKNDVITQYNGQLRIYPGNGAGGFDLPGGNPILLGAGWAFPTLAAADWTGDGKVDIITQGNGQLLIYPGNGAGGFNLPGGNPVALGAGWAFPTLAAGDWTGDGKTDIVTQGASQVLIYPGNGAGGFNLPGSNPIYLGSGWNFPTIGVGDWTGDGKADIVTQNATGLITYPGDGAGGLAPSPVLLGNGTATPVAVGDFTGDAKPDVLTQTSGALQLYRGNGQAGPDQGSHLLTKTRPAPATSNPDHPAPVTTYTYTDGSTAAVDGLPTDHPPLWLLRTVTDPRGGVTTYEYNKGGDLRRVTDPVGLVREFTYDELGRRVTESVNYDGTLRTVSTTTYDAVSRPVQVDGPAVTDVVTGLVHRQRTTTTYDDNSHPLTVTVSDIGGSAQPNASRMTQYHYDDADREDRVTDPMGFMVTRVFDAAGRVRDVIDQRGTTLRTTYDPRGLAVSTTMLGFVDDPVTPGAPRDVVLSQTAYDLAGRAIKSVDALGRVTATKYDAMGRPIDVRLYANNTAYTTAMTSPPGDPFQVLSTSTYSNGRLTQRTAFGDVVGGTVTQVQITTYTYDDLGRVKTETQSNTASNGGTPPGGTGNTTITRTYDAAGNVVKARTTGGGSDVVETRSRYDLANRPTLTIQDNGTTDLATAVVRDRRGLVTQSTDPRGVTLDVSDNPTVNAAYTTTTNYDVLGHATNVFSPSISSTVADRATGTSTVTTGQLETKTGYTTYGETAETRDPRGNITITTYDLNGRRTQISHPSYTPPGGTAITPTELFSYDQAGNLTQRTDRRGEITTWDFDKRNRVVRQIDPGVGANPAGVIRYTYDDANNRLSTVNQIGARLEWSYDELNRVTRERVKVRNGANPTTDHDTTYTYDYPGRPITTCRPPVSSQARCTTATFAPFGQQLTNQAALGQTTRYAYDGLNRSQTVTDPLGRTAKTIYDTAGRTTSTQRIFNGTVLSTETYGYDPAGNRTSLTRPVAGSVWTYTYDPLNRLTSVVQPVAAGQSITTSYEYDQASNLTKTIDGRGNTWLATYTTWNLLQDRIEPSTTAHPGVANRRYTNHYDAGGLVVRVDQPGAVRIDRTYDDLGRLTREASVAATNAPAATRTFSYDAAGRMTTFSHPSGTPTLTWDDRNLLTSITGIATLNSSFTYDTAGRMSQRVDAAGTTTYTWDRNDRLDLEADPLTGHTRDYGWNDANQVTTVSYATAGAASRTYGYDNLGRLQTDTLTAPGGGTLRNVTYAYDLNDNVTTETINPAGTAGAGTHTYTYDYGDRLTSWTNPATSTTTSYTYDNTGNRTQAGTTTSTYDQRNRLLTGGTDTYTWTPRGTLRTKTAGTATNYTFDGLGRMTAAGNITYQYDALNRTTQRKAGTATAEPFSYSGNDPDPTKTGTSTSTTANLIAHSPSGDAISLKVGTGTAQVIGEDRHGDVTSLFTPTGTTLTDSIDYDPYGVPTARTGTTTNHLGFQSDFTDPTTGLVNMGARWYAPTLDTFTSRDAYTGTLQTPVTLNQYTYANNNPISYFDPDGNCAVRYDGQFCASTPRTAFATATLRSKAPAKMTRDQRLEIDRRHHRGRSAMPIAANRTRAAKCELSDSCGGGSGVRSCYSGCTAISSVVGGLNAAEREFFQGFVDAQASSVAEELALYDAHGGHDFRKYPAELRTLDSDNEWGHLARLYLIEQYHNRIARSEIYVSFGKHAGNYYIAPIDIEGASGTILADIILSAAFWGGGAARRGFGGMTSTMARSATAPLPQTRDVTRPVSATEAAGTRIPWNSYADYPKVTINGREYANVGGRPYTQHAVDRLQPSGLGAPAGASGPGRSIAPGYVDDVLTGSQTVRKPVVGPNGEARVSHVSGSVEVITEGDIVITVITR